MAGQADTKHAQSRRGTRRTQNRVLLFLVTALLVALVALQFINHADASIKKAKLPTIPSKPQKGTVVAPKLAVLPASTSGTSSPHRVVEPISMLPDPS